MILDSAVSRSVPSGSLSGTSMRAARPSFSRFASSRGLGAVDVAVGRGAAEGFLRAVVLLRRDAHRVPPFLTERHHLWRGRFHNETLAR
jgi:hypothetical protein